MQEQQSADCTFGHSGKIQASLFFLMCGGHPDILLSVDITPPLPQPGVLWLWMLSRGSKRQSFETLLWHGKATESVFRASLSKESAWHLRHHSTESNTCRHEPYTNWTKQNEVLTFLHETTAYNIEQVLFFFFLLPVSGFFLFICRTKS